MYVQELVHVHVHVHVQAQMHTHATKLLFRLIELISLCIVVYLILIVTAHFEYCSSFTSSCFRADER